MKNLKINNLINIMLYEIIGKKLIRKILNSRPIFIKSWIKDIAVFACFYYIRFYDFISLFQPDHIINRYTINMNRIDRFLSIQLYSCSTTVQRYDSNKNENNQTININLFYAILCYKFIKNSRFQNVCCLTIRHVYGLSVNFPFICLLYIHYAHVHLL